MSGSGSGKLGCISGVLGFSSLQSEFNSIQRLGEKSDLLGGVNTIDRRERIFSGRISGSVGSSRGIGEWVVERYARRIGGGSRC